MTESSLPSIPAAAITASQRLAERAAAAMPDIFTSPASPISTLIASLAQSELRAELEAERAMQQEAARQQAASIATQQRRFQNADLLLINLRNASLDLHEFLGRLTSLRASNSLLPSATLLTPALSRSILGGIQPPLLPESSLRQLAAALLALEESASLLKVESRSWPQPASPA